MKKSVTIPVAILKALIAAYVISGIMLLFLAFLLYKFYLSDTTLAFGIVLIYLIANIIGGMITGKNVATRKFAWGILFGVIYVVILMAASMLLSSIPDVKMLILPCIVCITGAMFGGIIS